MFCCWRSRVVFGLSEGEGPSPAKGGEAERVATVGGRLTGVVVDGLGWFVIPAFAGMTDAGRCSIREGGSRGVGWGTAGACCC